MKLTTQQVLDLARKHVNNMAVMQSSAASCLDDAIAQDLKGNDENARMWAQASLRYSVGVFHPDYKATQEN